MTNISLCCLLLPFIAGCATVVNPVALRPSSAPAIYLEQEFTYDISGEMDLPRPGPGSYRGLLPGLYRAAYEDDDGVYYRADGECVIESAWPGRGLKYLTVGGVWIRKAGEAFEFRLFRIQGAGTLRAIPISEKASCQTATDSQEAQLATDAKGSIDKTGKVITVQAPTRLSMGQSIGASVISTVLINSMIENENGKIVMLPRPVESSSRSAAMALARLIRDAQPIIAPDLSRQAAPGR